MMMETLNEWIAHKKKVTLYTKNGYCLKGLLVEADEYAVMMYVDHKPIMVMMSAISSVAPLVYEVKADAK